MVKNFSISTSAYGTFLIIFSITFEATEYILEYKDYYELPVS